MIEKKIINRGKSIEERHYLDGKLHGDRTFWLEGIKIGEAHYKEGKLFGICRMWYTNGNMHIEEYYKEGLKSGPYRSWWEEGTKKEEGYYSNGKRIGVYKYYDETGKISTVYDYKEDGSAVNITNQARETDATPN